MSYADFLARKSLSAPPVGFDVPLESIHPSLMPFQRDLVRWALRRGRAALWEDCGLGKTFQQLEWARHIHAKTNGRVLILAPLAVSAQTLREAQKFGIEAVVARKQADAGPSITITNYEMLEHFDPAEFVGVVLDESSIIKNYAGKIRTQIIDAFRSTPYRLACTATPAPNDHMEIGNHAEFLGVMTRAEMLAMFFVHDGGETQAWRIKGHAATEFWRWVSSWAVMIRKPSDMGYADEGYDLPSLVYHDHVLDQDPMRAGVLFEHESLSLTERRQSRRTSITDRANFVASLVNASDEPWLVWCDLNDEADAVRSLVPGSIEVRGSDDREDKEFALTQFADGKIRVLISKPSIAGHGMNFQVCARQAFMGLSDSYEAMYQAVRRSWRFGQNRPVEVHVVTTTNDECVVENIKRKDEQAETMMEEMVKNMDTKTTFQTRRDVSTYAREEKMGKHWTMVLGDCVNVLQEVEENTIDFSVFSPPFASLYTYSNSDRDMGNCKNVDEFMVHMYFLTRELFRVMKSGRNVSFHCMNLPTSKVRDGYIGITDFRGDLIRLFQAAGFVYHSEVCIWKDPVTAMQRTKALGLLHKQLKKDSCMSRQGIPDYLVTMRKPGENANPVTNTNESFPVSEWQKYASPVWDDINPNDTLQRESAREDEDERHICPLQLEVIRRALRLWSKPDDLVLSPFGGIASEGYVAVETGRRYLGIELKKSYFDQAVLNLEAAVRKAAEPTLFGVEAM